MRRVLVAVFFGWTVLVAGCRPLPEVRIPLDSVVSRNGGKVVLVLLPGRGDRMDSFEKKGFTTMILRSGLPVDVIAADATEEYYADGSFVTRLREDVVLPARRGGYGGVWLIGISMGGTGALLYEREHPGEVDGVIAFAPYLGEEKVAEEIAQAGGLSRWRFEPRDTGRHSLAEGRMRDLYRWFGDRMQNEKAGRIYLCYGTRDRFARGAGILASTLPEGQTLTVAGGHDWRTWKKLLRRLLAEQGLRNRMTRPE